ncbi:SusC/RagA family TonB-linked outer membrane protein [Pedobacter nyackensis]|uniref:SusC/RagA family TonB-linked outer membrane protein n=1 Tax=Pedobacter nyackensis TaxID=475255 RepID=UPI00292D9BB9|nr:SusC/RagA family TonB-linked outer membrane protein [Pedobacter nyackensis]
MFKTTLTLVMATLCLNLNAYAQSPGAPFLSKNQAVSGKVISASTGETLPGAVVKVTSTNQTILTNDKGEFMLSLPNGIHNLSVSYLNHKTKNVSIQIPLKGLLLITLQTDDQNLKEVEINTGYYTVKDKERTGSISRVDAKTIAQQPVNNVLGALIGRMAGVNIEQSSGINGGGYTIEIRGRNSLRADGRQPLYLVDGIPYPANSITEASLGVEGFSLNSSPLNYISHTDIQSIEVLMDADATAIYGSRGANGVILITTKKARQNNESIGLNISGGFSKISKKLDLLNTAQYLELRNEAFKNDGAIPSVTDYDVNGTWNPTRYTDWQEKLIGGTARQFNVQSSFSGGNEFTQYTFRGNHSKQTTVSPGDFSDQKGSAGLNVNHSAFNRKLNLNFSTTYALDNNSLPQIDLTQYIDLAPNAPDIYESNGNLNWALDENGGATWLNPFSALKKTYLGKTSTAMLSGKLQHTVNDNLSVSVNVGLNSIKLKENLLTPISSQSPSPWAIGINQLSFNAVSTWMVEPMANYMSVIGSGKLDIIVGSTFQKDQQNAENLAGVGYTNDSLLESISAAPFKGGSSASSTYKYNALFGRINYSYKERYFVNFTGRRDGSSRFGANRQFANFGAVGAAWIFSNENLINKNLRFLSFGKIRGSYGITGSDQIPNYGYLSTYAASDYSYKNESAIFPVRLANPDFSWETNKKLEFALDLSFFNDRFSFSTNWYLNKSSDQLVGYSLPDITGFTSVQYNLPATVQNTGWEFLLNATVMKGSSLKWNTSLNLTVPRNKLLSYPNLKGSGYANTYAVGKSIYTPITYHYLGVDPKTGIYSFQDRDESETLNAADRTAAEKSLTSHYYGGLQNSFSLKGFQLDIFFQFVNKTTRAPILSFAPPGVPKNQPVQVLNRWQKPGDLSNTQKVSQTYGSVTSQFDAHFYSDYFSDASFIRLKNLSLSWTLPAALAYKTNIKLFIQGQNLLTFSSYIGDPEVPFVKTLPTLKTVILGVQVNL